MRPPITSKVLTWMDLGLHLISRAWEASTPNRTVSLRPLLKQGASGDGRSRWGRSELLFRF